jgi:type IV pilus assembly protein PilA
VAETAPDSGIDWSQYEAIVEKRWNHYKPRFERFARGGWLSWNWAAFFGTLAWFRYRKLHVWTGIYFFVSMPMLYAFLTFQSTGDACERALDPGAGSLPGLVVLCLIALAWIVPPLFADRIYYNHVRGQVDQTKAHADSGTSTGGITSTLVLQAFIFVGTVRTAASYGTYIYRSMASEGVSLAAGAKTPVQEYFNDHGRLPSRIEEVTDRISGKYVRSLALGQDGSVKAVFGEGGKKLAGRSVSMVPARKDGKIVEWSCRSEDLPNRCLPASCRRD